MDRLFRMPRLLGWSVAICFTVSLLGFVRSAPALQQRAPEAKESATAKFLRFKSDPAGGGTLQTSIIRYANDDGATVDLIGAVHIGDAAYYEFLNERFRRYDSLLYEMVKPADMEMGDQRGGGGGGLNLIHTLQRTMQTVLELDFQLDGIDYMAENFVHADMDLETFTRRQREQGEGLMQMMIRQMLRDMSRPQDPNYRPITMGELMEAMTAQDRARRMKLLFARELSRMDDMLEAFGGPGGSVILDERNVAAIEVMDQRLEAGERKLGIFYGAAHLKGMEELLEERGFHQVGEPEWLVAWDMTLDGSGREEMRQRIRQAIVEEAAAAGRLPAAGAAPEARADGAALRSLRRELAALRSEAESLRKENEALREQVQLLREQNAALRERSPER